MARKELRHWLEKNAVPDTFGVYRFYDAEDQVIYVGKSINLRRRMQQYLKPSRKKKYRKARTIVQEAIRVDFEVCLDEKSALLRENELIQLLKPRFNTAGAFSFLYPVIAARYTDRRLALVRTTMPDEYHDFVRFGAFRDRCLVNEMFTSLEFLLAIEGHKEPTSRLNDIPKAPYSKRMAFREVKLEYWPLLQDFLSGRDDALLFSLFHSLLSHPTAVAHATEVEVNLKILKRFFVNETQKLYLTCQNQGRDEVFVEQEHRDALFILDR